jgi:hypothetical protein
MRVGGDLHIGGTAYFLDRRHPSFRGQSAGSLSASGT